MSTRGVGRRTPQQARAKQRRAELLDAAAQVLATAGYDGTTTTAVAKRAGASVGTVYEYFPDRTALVAALLERYRERLHAALEPLLAAAGPRNWRTSTRRIVDAFVSFYRDEPGYRVLWLESLTTPSLRAAGAAWASEFGALLAGALAFAKHLSPERRHAAASVCMYLVSGVTSMALTGEPRRVAPVVREIKLALERYLELVLSPRARR